MEAYSISRLDEVAPGHHHRWVRGGLTVATLAYVVVATVDLILMGQPRYTSVSQMSVVALCLLGFWLLRRGKTDAASFVVIGAVCGDVFVNIVVEGTVVGSWMMVLPVVVAATGVLLGSRRSTTLAVILALSVLPAASIRGLLGQTDMPGGTDVLWTVILGACVGAVAALVHLSMRTFGNVMEAAVQRIAAQERIAHLGQIIDNALNEIYVFEAGSLRLRLVNRGARENLGYESRELSRMTMDQVNPTFQDAGGDGLALLLKGEEELSKVRGVHRRKDGSAYPVEMLLQAGTIGSDAVVVAFAEDISGREQADSRQRQLQRQLQHAQKLEAVGHLAGGVAHDFNNLLTVIGGYAELLTGNQDADTRHVAEEIRGAQQRGIALTRKLLAFARKEIRDPRPLCLREVVAELETMMAQLLGKGYGLEVTAHTDGWIVGDQSQLEQVLLNLVSNARDAMEGGGRVVISVDAAPPDPKTGQARVRLTVRDDGPGMTEDLQERAFEPFFTTKPRGKGTGLGLSTVHGIVSQSGGSVEIESAPGQGCAVHVFLPAATPPRTAGSDGIPRPATPRSAATVLVAEDEDGTRALVVRMLERAGYRVVAVSNARSALDVLESDSHPVDMVLSDVVMPGMNGIDLAREIRRLRPELGVLLMSGYVDDRLAGGDALDPATDLLLKPFSADELSERVARVLAAP